MITTHREHRVNLDITRCCKAPLKWTSMVIMGKLERVLVCSICSESADGFRQIEVDRYDYLDGQKLF